MRAGPFVSLLFLSFGAAHSSPPPDAAATVTSEPEELTDGSKPDEIAGVYRYVDESGEEHYTNNPAEIPKGRRPVAVRGGALSTIPRSGPSKPPPVAAVMPSPGDRERETNNREEEAYWRGRFRTALQNVAAIEASLGADRDLAHQLEPFSVQNGRCGWGGAAYGYPRGNYCHTLNELLAVRERVKEKEVALARAQEELANLEREASFNAVPREWRR